jgi:DNA repair protein RecN (Recombination protein N)
MPLRELNVENLAVLSSVRLSLSPGFTVVTGETGAGKSLVVDALSLALGARASSDAVRSGTDAARIEAIFDDVPRDAQDPLDELVGAGDGMVIVRREVSADGRSMVRVNDRAVTVRGLAALGARLAEIHGQHEQQRLFDPARQLALLDRAGELDELRGAVEVRYRAWRAVVAASAELVTDERELARRVELLRHQVDEIGSARLEPDEDAVLEAAVRAAQHAEEIARAASDAVRSLRDDDAALESLAGATASLQAAAQHDDRFAPLVDRAHALVAEAEELARDSDALGGRVDLDATSREAAEERLTLVYDLKRKYGPSLDDVAGFAESAAHELEMLEDQEGARERLRADEQRTRSELEAAATRLTAARLTAAERLAGAVNAELPPLGLPAGAFGVELFGAEIGLSGADRVAFSFAPNAGEPPRPLARIASGGEASRLSLAIEVVLAGADDTPVLVFDEVDAGVGGRNAGALGERLKALAAYHQVLCVTHLPQIAAHADTHVRVGKRVEGGRTFTELRVLSTSERASELAAMLAGEGAGHEAQAAAAALLRSVQ